MNYYEIPLTADPQKFTIRLSGTDYVIRLYYLNTDEGGWVIDIGTSNNVAIVNGIPLLTGTNLLEQYDHLGFAGRLWVQTKSNPNAVPTWENLGIESFLFWVTD